ncbi:MAG: hypothetical protein AAF655_12095 [Bacteroidota bacterium]
MSANAVSTFIAEVNNTLVNNPLNKHRAAVVAALLVKAGELVESETAQLFIRGSGAPSDLLGSNGQYYIDDDNRAFYGPKTNDTWDSTGPFLINDGKKPYAFLPSNEIVTYDVDGTFLEGIIECDLSLASESLQINLAAWNSMNLGGNTGDKFSFTIIVRGHNSTASRRVLVFAEENSSFNAGSWSGGEFVLESPTQVEINANGVFRIYGALDSQWHVESIPNYNHIWMSKLIYDKDGDNVVDEALGLKEQLPVTIEFDTDSSGSGGDPQVMDCTSNQLGYAILNRTDHQLRLYNLKSGHTAAIQCYIATAGSKISGITAVSDLGGSTEESNLIKTSVEDLDWSNTSQGDRFYLSVFKMERGSQSFIDVRLDRLQPLNIL